MTTTQANMTTNATREIQYRQAINEALRQEMERDETVIIMGEEIAGGAGREHLGIVDAWGGPFRTTVGLIQQFGNQRVLDTPLSEAAFIGAAIGAASTGMRAIAELMFVDFIGVCMDQLINNAAKMRYMFGGQVKIPFTLLTRIGAGFGSAAQHSESYYSIFSHIPGLKGVVPSDPYTAKGLLVAAIRDDDQCLLRAQGAVRGNRPGARGVVRAPLGQSPDCQGGHRRHAGGYIAHDLGVHRCGRGADQVGDQRRSNRPIEHFAIDYDHVIDSVRRTHRLVVVDEDTPICSIASDICARVAEEAFDYLDAPPSRVTAPHTPVPTAGLWKIPMFPTRPG